MDNQLLTLYCTQYDCWANEKKGHMNGIRTPKLRYFTFFLVAQICALFCLVVGIFFYDFFRII